jgi:hypothetical protein
MMVAPSLGALAASVMAACTAWLLPPTTDG